MKLVRLYIQGFKSFKDRTTIEFDDGITGIVGPNGCGKSNIVDALFWVMGEQSAKHLRGTNMKDLIFAGSSKYSPASFAEVTLVLENTNGKHIHISGTVAKPAEIQLTRKLYRNGETEYRINGEPARLKDIHEVFMDTGAGAKSYSIIAQGEINKLVQAKPEERRTMIEEVAGITKFKLRKRDSLKKIELTQQNLARLEDLQAEIYKNLKNLEKQAEKAERARSLRERIKRYELITDAHKEFEFLQDWTNADRILEERAIEIEQLTLRRQQLDLLLEDERVQKADAMDKINDAQEDFNTHSRQLAASEEKMKHLKRAIAEKEKLIATRIKENEELEVDTENRTRRAEELSTQLSELEGTDYGAMDFSEREERSELLKQQLIDLEEELQAARKNATSAKDELSALDQQQFRNTSKIEEYSRLLQDIAAEIEVLEKQDSTSRDDLIKERERFNLAKAALEEIQVKIPELKTLVETLNSEVKVLDGEIRNLQREIIQTESKRDSLIEVNQQAEGKKLGAQNLVAAHPQGGIEVLGRLIQCEEGYAAAVEELLSDALDSVLIASGKEIIADLGNNFHQVADIIFTTEDVISAETSERLSLALTGVRPLAEVVKCTDESFKTSLNKLLSGYFIASNLNEETAALVNPAIGFKGIVSLDGKTLIKKSLNTITYGLRRLPESEQGMGVVERNGLIEKLSIDLEEKKVVFADLESKLMAKEEMLIAEKAKLEALLSGQQEAATVHASVKASLDSKEKTFGTSSSRLEILQNRKSETSSLRLALLESEEKIAREKKAIDERHQNSAAHMEEIESRHIDLKISYENERDELLELKVKAQSYEQQLKSLRSQISDTEGQLERLNQKAEQNKLQLALAEEEMQQAETEVEQGEEENLVLAEQLADKEQFLSLLKDQLSQILLGMQDKETELKDATAKLNKLEKENVELELRQQQILTEEEILVKNAFEKHRVDLRFVIMNHLELTTEKLSGLADLSAMYLMEGEEGPVTVTREEWEFTKRYPAEVRDYREKLKECRTEFNRLGEINWQAIEDYDRQKLRHDFLKTQEEELKRSLADLQTAIMHIDEKSRERFKEAFHEVNERFSKVFPIIFGGGSARLDMTGDIDSPEAGVDIIAQPPGKKMQSITLMSGGEKAMTAVSLIFSIFLVKPSPFCLLDEVDAPLDDANVGRFNELLREMSGETQFILITHNKKTMELNDTLYGVTMQEPGVSKAVSVQLH
ncbi:MAG: chromosome segregation protein SMC [Bacteriovoracaceae bacterium]|nr:chromosome segregation protein SMC [Bacteriovoracaceae bacterium]